MPTAVGNINNEVMDPNLDAIRAPLNTSVPIDCTLSKHGLQLDTVQLAPKDVGLESSTIMNEIQNGVEYPDGETSLQSKRGNSPGDHKIDDFVCICSFRLFEYKLIILLYSSKTIATLVIYLFIL